jgi:hypothetical protein
MVMAFIPLFVDLPCVDYSAICCYATKGTRYRENTIAVFGVLAVQLLMYQYNIPAHRTMTNDLLEAVWLRNQMMKDFQSIRSRRRRSGDRHS